MTRWILAAMVVVGMGALGAATASATDYNDVQSEWRDYQREMRRGHYRHAQKEYREYCRKLQKYNSERFGGYYGPAYGGMTYATGSYGPRTYYGGTTVYYAQPTVYPQQTYYYSQRPYIATGGGVVIWR